jgi:hypothetical protein
MMLPLGAKWALVTLLLVFAVGSVWLRRETGPEMETGCVEEGDVRVAAVWGKTALVGESYRSPADGDIQTNAGIRPKTSTSLRSTATRTVSSDLQSYTVSLSGGNVQVDAEYGSAVAVGENTAAIGVCRLC